MHDNDGCATLWCRADSSMQDVVRCVKDTTKVDRHRVIRTGGRVCG